MKEEIKKLRDSGFTYQEIGNRIGVSRQRIHQILTGYRVVSKSEREKVFKKFNYECQWGETCKEDFHQKLTIFHKDLDTTNNDFDNLTIICDKCRKKLIELNYPICDYCNKKEYPTVYYDTKWLNRGDKKICKNCFDRLKNEHYERISKMWNPKYKCCIECGTTKKKYLALGMCNACYSRKFYEENEHRRISTKKANKNWQKNNPEKVKIIQKKASRQYQKKHEEELRIKARKRYRNDEEYRKKRIETSKKYHKNNPEISRKLSRKYYYANKEEVKRKSKERYHAKKNNKTIS